MRTLILILIVVTGLALSGVAGIVTNRALSGLDYENSAELLEEVAALMSDKLDIGIFERYKDVQVLSTLETLRDPSVSNDEKRELLDQLKLAYSDYAFIAITDTEGKVLVSAERLLEGENVSQRPWFIETMKGEPYVGDVHEALLLAKLIPNLTGEPLRFVDVAFPIKDDAGNILGVLGTHLSWSWANEVRSSLIDSINDRTKIDVFILSSNKDILLGTNDLQGEKLELESVNLAISGQSGSRVEKWRDGNEYITAYQPTDGYRTYDGIGWVILARERVSEPDTNAPIVVFGIGAGITLLSTILAIIYSKNNKNDLNEN